MTKELSIESIKKELMNAFLGDMRIIKSFANKEVKKVNDYIGTNIFNYLNKENIYDIVDTYIYFDVSEGNMCSGERYKNYEVHIIIRMHKDLVIKNGENKLDTLASIVMSIVRELYPYMIGYSNIFGTCDNNHYIERKINFSLYPNDDKKKCKSLDSINSILSF